VSTTIAAAPRQGVLPTARNTRGRSQALQILLWVVQNRMGAAGLAILLVLAVLAIAAPLVAPYPPNQQHPGQELRPPGGAYLLGTDELGRDMLSRILYGSRISFMVGIVAVVIGASVGVATGLAAGYFGGWVDTVIMRCYDALQAFPAILLGITIVTVLGPSAINVAYALGIATLPGFARLTRSQVLSVRERDFVLAARCIGAAPGRIMAWHVLPNCVAPLLVQVALIMGISVLAEAALSFLGLGTQPPDPSWGAMLNTSRGYLRQNMWYGIFPGLALATMLIALNYLTDALRDALDPHRVR
jgi:peptide/nickel transport system permease protein